MTDTPLLEKRRYQAMRTSEDFSDEEMARDWTLSESDKAEVSRYHKSARLWLAVQLCAVRLYGRLIQQVDDVSARVLSYLSKQLGLPPTLRAQPPEREATALEYRKNLLTYLGFSKFDEDARADLERWLSEQAQQGQLPAELFPQAEARLLKRRVLLPGPTVLERLIAHVCADEHTSFFRTLDASLPDDKLVLSTSVNRLQKAVDSHMPLVRIEQLLIEVDRLTGFTQHFEPLHTQQARPIGFHRTLLAALISQATNLGVVSMSASMKEASVDSLRRTLRHFVREETLKEASAAIVDAHHQLPLSALHGDGTFSSSDAQRFKIRASSLLASYYPRYYGYYEKAIGIYTHTSDQYSVFGTRAISCSPREALYVLDGLLENNTVLQIKAHTTDTHGYTEIIFALCHLLGYDFMPRIRDLKDQQLYKLDRQHDYGVFAPLLTKTADAELIEEQWEEMIRVAVSLKERTAPAHVVVQRLTSSYPADRLSKAFTNLGRVIKTRYILRYLTDRKLRQAVQLQLNKGEYRHKLARRVFFADQGAFSTGDYEEIMNKASCLSLVSNAILYWNTLKISDIVAQLRSQGEVVEDADLRHISLLPYKHIVPNGTYFIEDYMT